MSTTKTEQMMLDFHAYVKEMVKYGFTEAELLENVRVAVSAIPEKS